MAENIKIWVGEKESKGFPVYLRKAGYATETLSFHKRKDLAEKKINVWKANNPITITRGYAGGGEIEEKRERVADYIATHEDLDNYEELDEDWYDWEFDKKLKWVNKNVLKDDKDVKYYFDKFLNDTYAEGGEVEEKRERVADYIATCGWSKIIYRR